DPNLRQEYVNMSRSMAANRHLLGDGSRKLGRLANLSRLVNRRRLADGEFLFGCKVGRSASELQQKKILENEKPIYISVSIDNNLCTRFLTLSSQMKVERYASGWILSPLSL